MQGVGLKELVGFNLLVDRFGSGEVVQPSAYLFFVGDDRGGEWNTTVNQAGEDVLSLLNVIGLIFAPSFAKFFDFIEGGAVGVDSEDAIPPEMGWLRLGVSVCLEQAIDAG